MTGVDDNMSWPNETLMSLLGTTLPIVQAPMAGASGADMAVAACEAGALGSLPCAMLSRDDAEAQIRVIQQRTSKPLNLNFFCHTPVAADADRESEWKARLAPYYQEFGLDASASAPPPSRVPFDESMCELVEQYRPQVVSFHFGLPDPQLMNRVRSSAAVVLSSATTVAEARWLAERGCDAIVAQGYEAGGHRGMFLTDDITTQPGTMALVPQVVDAVDLPVIAAGGIADARGIAAAFALGAAGVQLGTAYLFTPESTITDIHRAALHEAGDDQTALTNVFSGRPARGITNRVMREVGPMSEHTPAFPFAGGALAPLKAQAESTGSGDFSSLWAGQAAGLAGEPHPGTGELTQNLAREALALLSDLAP